MTQTDALNILKTGKNVFITGPAGSGKTFVVNQYIRYLKDHEVHLGITASTGIAATHMGGVTIHSWSGIGIKDRLSQHDVEEISERSNVRKKIEDTKVLIIDEVSMLHHFRLDLVDQVLKHIKKSEAPFGGIQIVLCGDFFQLPPISRMGEREALFVYASDSWKDGNFDVCYLSENFRQADDVSVSILNEIRSGEVSEASLELLKSRFRTTRKIIKAKSQHSVSYDDDGFVQSGAKEYDLMGDVIEPEIEEEVVEVSDNHTGIEPTRLYTHNIDVDTVNETQLKKVDGYECTYEMTSKGKKPLVETLKKSCLAPELLRLKKGARVMCVKNNFEKGYVNGTLGVVIICGFGVDPVIRTASTPDYPDGRLVTIEKAEWSIDDDGKVIAEISQYPLRLAWAITVHKSQGMSLDAVEVDLSKSFAPGMGYVALSRVRTLAGLTILGLNEHALKVHPDVLEHDYRLRELSHKAESIISYTDKAELMRSHEEFLARVAPLYSIVEGKLKKSKVPKAPKLTTFGVTANFIREQKTIQEICEARDMADQTIITHIEKLIELGPDRGGLELSDIFYLKKEISPVHFMKIGQAFEEASEKQTDGKPPLLSPIKNKVGANITFRNIQLARVLLGYIRKAN
ncbi:MAG: AAA family ATPase [bacterium]|nr:AAA family ATPase [bacterium]